MSKVYAVTRIVQEGALITGVASKVALSVKDARAALHELAHTPDADLGEIEDPVDLAKDLSGSVALGTVSFFVEELEVALHVVLPVYSLEGLPHDLSQLSKRVA